jgi:hypothetical protein
LSDWWQREWDCRLDSWEKAFVQPEKGKRNKTADKIVDDHEKSITRNECSSFYPG